MDKRDIDKILRGLYDAQAYANRAEKQVNEMRGCMQTRYKGLANIPATSITCIQSALKGAIEHMEKVSVESKPRKRIKK